MGLVRRTWAYVYRLIILAIIQGKCEDYAGDRFIGIMHEVGATIDDLIWRTALQFMYSTSSPLRTLSQSHQYHTGGSYTTLYMTLTAETVLLSGGAV
jgi:hypothetical protein